MKKFLVFLLALTMLFSAIPVSFASDGDEREANEIVIDPVKRDSSTFKEESTIDRLEGVYNVEILNAYKSFCEYISENELPASVSIEVFSEGFQQGNYSIDEYLQLCINEVSQLYVGGEYETSQASVATSSDGTWFYNTSTTLYQKPNYSKYNLLNIVQAGDIIYEASGGSGLTGHCVMVEGIYYSTDYAQYYIRVIEAIGYLSGSIGEGEGVCRGILDDDRIDSRQGTILRVSSATSSQKTNAISFCRNQIGKEYEVASGGHSTSSSATDWYCSELIWAAYYNQGIDLESDRGVWVTPAEILASSKVTTISKNTIGTPTISSITATSATSATVTWGTVSGASKYYVYRATSESGTYSLVTTTTSTSYTNTGLTSGSTYYYRVAAYNSAGLGNQSSVKAVKLSFSVPVITASYTPTSTSAYLEWSTVYGATGYYVYRSTSASGTYTKIATTSSRSYTNSGLTSGTTYYYKIVAYNSSTSSSYSSYRSVTPVVVNKPQIYYVKTNSSSKVTVRWTNVPNATVYYVYRSTSATGTYSCVSTTSQTTYTNLGLSSGTTYYYKIRAYYNGTYSAYSAYSSVSTS